MRNRPFLLAGIPGLAVFIVVAYLTAYTNTADSSAQRYLELPNYLKEASGLARVDDTHLLVHNDEEGHVYLINLEDPGISTLITVGDPVIMADFEGIAVNHSTVYLVTSAGILHVINNVSFEPAGQTVETVIFDTGLKNVCEVEGLHFDDGALLLACKNVYAEKKKNTIKVFAFTPGTSESAEQLFSLEHPSLKGKRKKVTAIESDASYYYLLTRTDLLKVGRNDLSIAFYPLDTDTHDQPEGLAIMSDGSFFLVDDRSKAQGSLTRYPCCVTDNYLPASP